MNTEMTTQTTDQKIEKPTKFDKMFAFMSRVHIEALKAEIQKKIGVTPLTDESMSGKIIGELRDCELFEKNKRLERKKQSEASENKEWTRSFLYYFDEDSYKNQEVEENAGNERRAANLYDLAMETFKSSGGMERLKHLMSMIDDVSETAVQLKKQSYASSNRKGTLHVNKNKGVSVAIKSSENGVAFKWLDKSGNEIKEGRLDARGLFLLDDFTITMGLHFNKNLYTEMLKMASSILNVSLSDGANEREFKGKSNLMGDILKQDSFLGSIVLLAFLKDKGFEPKGEAQKTLDVLEKYKEKFIATNNQRFSIKDDDFREFLVKNLKTGSVETIERIWGDVKNTRFKDLDMVANNLEVVKEILSNDGMQGVFSLLMARSLGLPVTRSLTANTWRMMAENGMTKGGWKSLSQLDTETLRDGLLVNALPQLLPKLALGYQQHFIDTFAVVKEIEFSKKGNEELKKSMDDLSDSLLYEELPKSISRFLNAASQNGLESIHLKDLFKMEDSWIGKKSGIWKGLPSQALDLAMAFNDREEFDKEEAACVKVSVTLLKEACLNIKKFGMKNAERKIEDVLDFLSRSEWGVFQRCENLSFKGIESAMKEWHEMLATQERDKRAGNKWESSLVEADGPQGLKAISLNNGQELFDEGKTMHHCVSSYWSDCLSGESRIFSIKRGERNVGTLQLSLIGGEWRNVQFKGPWNKPIKQEDALEFANEMARLYTEAYKKEQRQAAALVDQISSSNISGLALKTAVEQHSEDMKKGRTI